MKIFQFSVFYVPGLNYKYKSDTTNLQITETTKTLELYNEYENENESVTKVTNKQVINLKNINNQQYFQNITMR